jgi:hypothetical protein
MTVCVYVFRVSVFGIVQDTFENGDRKKISEKSNARKKRLKKVDR